MRNNYLIILLLIAHFFMYGCQQEIETEFVEKINIEEKFQYPSKLINNKEQFVHIFNQEHKPLFKLKNYIDFNKYDLKGFDYLITFGEELIQIKLSDDDCDYLGKTPIETICDKSKFSNYIYVYKVLVKDKYRNICP